MKHLEPVVKTKSSFSILLLRDDHSVVRFRLKPLWFKVFVVLFALFSVSSGAAGYAAHYYWKKYTTLQQERSVMAEKLGENRRKLDEFAGMERIEAVLPRSAMSSVGVAAVSGNAHQEQGENASAKNQDGAAKPEPPQPQAATIKPEPPQEKTTAAPESAQPAVEPPGVSESTVREKAVFAFPAGSAQAGHAPPGSGDGKEHPVLIDDVLLRQTGAKRYALSFGLSNRDKQLRLNGRVYVSIADKDGKMYEVSQVNRDALRFMINNYKKVSTVFSLPAGLADENASRLVLTVAAEDIPDIAYSFPMSEISSSASR